MSWWQLYQEKVRQSFGGLEDLPVKGLDYWRKYLFISSITYLLPLSLIALIPGVLVALSYRFYTIAFFDLLAVVVLLSIAFIGVIPYALKKLLFIFITYLLAIVLLFTLGSFGPGLVYLLAIAIFMVIILPDRFAFLPVWINLGFCIAYGFFIAAGMTPGASPMPDILLSWVAIASNLIFLTLVFSVLIPKLFSGMQKSIDEQVLLRQQLSQEQQKLQESVKQLNVKNEELEQFAYITSHDLQEPLRMITGFMTRLKDKYAATMDEKANQYIYFAIDGAQRMRQIILDLLAFSRIGKQPGRKEYVNLNSLLQNVLQVLEPEIQAQEAQIEISRLPVVHTFGSLLQQVFQNIISNSLKYHRPDQSPHIRIWAEEEPEQWLIQISDNGIGIEEEYYEKIFIIFQRLHGRESYGGTGIGLAIVKKILEYVGGKAGVRSVPGEGSVFYFTLPKS